MSSLRALGKLLGDATVNLNMMPGATVEIHGLKGAAELNGLSGKLKQFDHVSGRWQVELLSSGDVKALKPENLTAKQLSKEEKGAKAAMDDSMEEMRQMMAERRRRQEQEEEERLEREKDIERAAAEEVERQANAEPAQKRARIYQMGSGSDGKPKMIETRLGQSGPSHMTSSGRYIPEGVTRTQRKSLGPPKKMF